MITRALKPIVNGARVRTLLFTCRSDVSALPLWAFLRDAMALDVLVPF